MAEPLDVSLASIQLVRLNHQLNRLLDEQLRPLGLRRGQHAVLLAIADLGQTTPTVLATRLDIDKAAVSRSLSSCEANGWVSVGFAPDSSKTRLAELTTEGRRLVKHIHAALINVERAFQQQVSPALYRALKSERIR